MDRRARTYSWFLLLVFVLGGVIVPALHFNQHANDAGNARPVASDVVFVQTPDGVDYADCTLCDARMGAPALVSAEQETHIYIEAVLPRAPQRLALGMIGNTSDRGPPAPVHG